MLSITQTITVIGEPSEKFDKSDKRIISLLMEKPEMTQTAIASCLKLSQPAVYARIPRLRNSGMITRIVGVNLNDIRIVLFW